MHDRRRVIRSCGIVMLLLGLLWLGVIELAGAAKEPPHGKRPKEINPLAGCQMCHVDIEDEYVVSEHFKEKVSCIECHGKSAGHLADENNEVAPDFVFTRKNTDKFCAKCHDCELPEATRRAGDGKICTDCHGSHDLHAIGEGASDEE
ncbi:MAG: hypothetical protein HQ581_22415 [Planctomycetes bacterium]|nr:hypothetical protein [Planctomycetota bacterium]